jgi:hypothetical protein
MRMPDVEVYERSTFACPQPARPWDVVQFPVYVASGMPLDQAQAWVLLVVWWLRVLFTRQPQQLTRPITVGQLSREHVLEMCLVTSGFYERLNDRRKRRAWAQSSVHAGVWWCSDEHCDCVQPVIERITPNHRAGYPWVHRERLWEGTFVSRSYGYPDGVSDDTLLAELRQACEQRGISVPDEAREAE